jgi:hypothetical protein
MSAASVSLPHAVPATQSFSSSHSSSAGSLNQRPVYQFQKGDGFYLTADQPDNTHSKVQQFFLAKIKGNILFQEDFDKICQEKRVVFFRNIDGVNHLALHVKWMNGVVQQNAGNYGVVINGISSVWQVKTAEGYIPVESGHLTDLLDDQMYATLNSKIQPIRDRLKPKPSAPDQSLMKSAAEGQADDQVKTRKRAGAVSNKCCSIM